MKLYVNSLSPMSRKARFANALLGMPAEELPIDFSQKEHKTPEFLGLNPNGKVPVLTLSDGTSLWESNAIVNRLAAETKSELWPPSNARYDILRWQFWEAAHWTPVCSPFIIKKFFDAPINLDEATEKLAPFARVLNGQLEARTWITGDQMTAADISVAGILSHRKACEIPLAQYPHVTRWIERIEAMPEWQKAIGA